MMNENEFDQLLRESFEREELLENINRQVMLQLKHAKRRSRLQSWTRVFIFAFAFPIAVLVYLATAYNFLRAGDVSDITTIIMLLSGIILLFTSTKAIFGFSLPKV